MKHLLVSGCSVTHGADLYNKFMHPENIKKSFSQHLANLLECNLVNVALSAGSNEYIFHSIVEQIETLKDIHSVIIVWTGGNRLYWKTNDRHYFFLGNFASSLTDLVNFKMHDKHVNNCWFTGDNDEIVDRISKVHPFFVTEYFDSERDLKKLNHYKYTLNSLCKEKNLPLISLQWSDIAVGSWFNEGRHPNESEHAEIANLIYKKYYDN